MPRVYHETGKWESLGWLRWNGWLISDARVMILRWRDAIGPVALFCFFRLP